MLKKKGGKGYDGASEKADQARIVEQANENQWNVLIAQLEKGKYSDIWFLDSGCTRHVCPKREWFSTYKPYDGGSVLLGNDIVFKTIGISNIHMRMFDGQVRTLMNLRHILDLRKNLLSLGALKVRGTSFQV